MVSKKRSKAHKAHKANDEIEDERFQAAVNRPQFQKAKAQSSKVLLDNRFASVLTDPRFRLQEKDKYGRKKKQTAKAELSSFYTVGDESEKASEQVQSEEAEDEAVANDSEESSSDEEDGSHAEEQAEDPASRIAFLTALSRGELSVTSSSEDEDASHSSEDDDASDDDEYSTYGTAGVLDPSSKEQDQVSLTEEPTPYMAVTNMDWSNVRAVDLFAILASFTSPGAVKRVQVFPSNFGMERMAKEAQYGPTGIWKNKSEVGDDDDDEEESDESESEQDEVSVGGDEEGQEYPGVPVDVNHVDSDFDAEKLRAYEASKLKYFFAVVEFASSEHADVAYREVDGFELEHSSAAVDMRAIPPNDLPSVIQDRKLRDQATSIPSNYEPPDFVVNALQQTNVKCTWDDGDIERERKLTAYIAGDSSKWGAQTEGDDLRAYLASDVSSDDEEDEEADSDTEIKGKGSRVRKLLGLDSDDEDDDDRKNSDDGSSASEGENEEEENAVSKQITFIPGKGSLADRIRAKLDSKKEEEEELTPWQKYQLKRKEKRRERKQASRNNSKGGSKLDDEKDDDDDGMYESDPEFGKAEFDSDDQNDDFFLEENKTAVVNTKKIPKGKKSKAKQESAESTEDRAPSSKEELELLLAGDNEEEATKDYDMRGLVRINKNKDKKLRGSRKRKEAELASNVSGTAFKIDTKDTRFAAVLDGSDDRFGIDRMDPNFKETEAMKEILVEQTKRRKAKKRAKTTNEKVAPNISADAEAGKSGGAAALSSLVMSLKSKVAKSKQ